MFDGIGIEALAILGGGGSLVAAKMIADAGFPVVAVPCTIDNDILGTYYTIGFDSACNRVISAGNDIVDTAEALEGRVFLLETLGGDTGHIATAAAYAISADAVLVPEVEAELPVLCERIRLQMDAGKPYAVIVVAEGAGPAQSLVDPIAKMIGRRVRVTALGHAQRGGAPTYRDRTMAREFGERAVELLRAGECDMMVAMASGSVTEVPLSVPCAGRKPLDVTSYIVVNAGLSAES
jgi:6-phosphofructokinase 1